MKYTYTQSELVEILNVTRQSITNYAKKGLITKGDKQGKEQYYLNDEKLQTLISKRNSPLLNQETKIDELEKMLDAISHLGGNK